MCIRPKERRAFTALILQLGPGSGSGLPALRELPQAPLVLGQRAAPGEEEPPLLIHDDRAYSDSNEVNPSSHFRFRLSLCGHISRRKMPAVDLRYAPCLPHSMPSLHSRSRIA